MKKQQKLLLLLMNDGKGAKDGNSEMTEKEKKTQTRKEDFIAAMTNRKEG